MDNQVMGDFPAIDPPGWVIAYGFVVAVGFLVASGCLVAGAVGAIKAVVHHKRLQRWTRICFIFVAAYAIVFPVSLAILSNIKLW
jgi:hypothetical protein